MSIKSLLAHKFFPVLVVCYTLFIAWVSLAKLIFTPNIHIEGGDKIGHAIAYFVLTVLWFLAIYVSRKANVVLSFSRTLMIVAFLGCGYGLLMEYLQKELTDYRMFDWLDALANTTGIIFAVVLLKIVENKLISYIVD